MKKALLLFVLFCCSKPLLAQSYVNIPDANFAAWLRSNVRTAMNGNQLDTSSFAVSTLTSINVQNKNIVNLYGIQYFSSLTYLNCYNNHISSLPDLPASLKYLSCGANPLTSLPDLPASLQALVCYHDSLNSLPDLPASLQNLVCYHNQLKSLPELPASLTYLDCSDNFLTGLPALPALQQTLYCNDNQLSNLPVLPVSLIQLNCENNRLTALPVLPGMLHTLVCYHNKISCFPGFPSSIVYGGLNIVPNPFTCLPNYIPAMDSITLVSFPLCREGNVHSCPVVIVSLGADNSKSLAAAILKITKDQVSDPRKQSILVFDVMGNAVFIQSIADDTVPSQEELSSIINSSPLSEGVYTICIASNAGMVNKRLVLVK
jgi:hypothetical protein